MFAGSLVTIPYIAFLNWRATDGPYFSPPLVALAIVAALSLWQHPSRIETP